MARARTAGRLATPYAQPAAYDVAFAAHREAEVAFLVGCFRRWRRGRVRRVLDIACGTGPHLLRLARRGYRVTGLDTSAPNLAYVAERARRAGVAVTLTAQDMAAFRLAGRYDAAICLQSSQGYLLTNADLLRHFRSVARALRPGGLYVFDRYLLSSWRDPVRRWVWQRRRGEVTVRSALSVLHDVDPVGQTFDERLTLEVGEGPAAAVYRHVERIRLVFPQELRTLVALASGFQWLGWFARYSLARPLERARRPMMLVAVLRRR
jgi:SAM-dependent methyltransferase